MAYAQIENCNDFKTFLKYLLQTDDLTSKIESASNDIEPTNITQASQASNNNAKEESKQNCSSNTNIVDADEQLHVHKISNENITSAQNNDHDELKMDGWEMIE